MMTSPVLCMQFSCISGLTRLLTTSINSWWFSSLTWSSSYYHHYL